MDGWIVGGWVDGWIVDGWMHSCPVLFAWSVTGEDIVAVFD